MAEAGAVMVTMLPDTVALKPLDVIFAAILAAVVVVLLSTITAGLDISATPFTVRLTVLPLKAVIGEKPALPLLLFTIGVKPAAPAGPVIVITFKDAVALYPAVLNVLPILAAKFVATALLVLAAVVAPKVLICVPFTNTVLTTVLVLVPVTVIVAVGAATPVAEFTINGAVMVVASLRFSNNAAPPSAMLHSV